MRGIFKSIAALTFTYLVIAFTPHAAVANISNQGFTDQNASAKILQARPVSMMRLQSV